MRKIDRIILHCSATPEGREVSAAQITAWHKSRGFRTIGYHWIVALDGSVSAGRPEAEIGAHCLGQNANSIGVCYIGGLDRDSLQPKDTRTPAQREALRRLVRELQLRYPGATVHAHREFAPKACPCFDITDL